MDALPMLTAIIAGLAFWMLFMSVPGAILVRAAACWTLKMDVPFGNAYVTSMLSQVIGFAITILIALLAIEAGPSQAPGTMTVLGLLALPAHFAIVTKLFSWRLSITLDQAAKMTGLLFGIAVVLGLLLGFLGAAVGK